MNNYLSEEERKRLQGIYSSTNSNANSVPYSTQLKNITNEIMNQKDFSYDINQDALYQQYADRYVQQGKLASQDVAGQAAAMTGGYGNSYAQSVGQQAYQGYLQGLNDVIPELYQLALERHQNKTNDLYSKASLLNTLEQQEYNRQYQKDRDKVSDELSYAELYLNSQGKMGYDNGGISTENIKKMQESLGLEPTGKWDSTSTKAANNLSATEAWDAYNKGTLGKLNLSYNDIEAEFKNMLANGKSYSYADVKEYIDAHEEEGYITKSEADKFREIIGKIPSHHWR